MKNSNVCKFTLSEPSNDPSVFCFVLETDVETMLKRITLRHHRMILIEQGNGEFLINDHPYSFSAGTLLFAFEGESFALSKGNDLRYLYIDFDGVRRQNLCQRFAISPLSRKRDNLNSLIPFFKDCLLSTQQENIDIVAESVLLYAFSRLSSIISPKNDIIQKVISFTENNFQNHELSISMIAQNIGYNSKYLSHYFKKKMNISYSEYLRSIRFKFAISLFESGISSVKNVAFLCGFSDSLYFSNSFKKSIGISPKEFISKLSNGEKE